MKIADIRKLVLDYYSGDMSRHMDMTTLKYEYDDDAGAARYSVSAKSFSQVSGLVRLGSGCYADVYAIDDKRVLKIVKKRDSGYARFATICKNNQGNPHLPVIHYSGEWAGKQCYILERLEEDNPNPRFSDTIFSRGDGTYDLFRSALKAARGAENGNPFLDISPAVREVAALIGDMIDDLHNGNMMFRGSVLVITDPTSSEASC